MPSPSGATPHFGYPYLLESDVPDVATASQLLAQAVETTMLVPLTANPAAMAYAGTSAFGMSTAAIMGSLTMQWQKGGFTLSTHGLTIPVTGVYSVQVCTWQTMGGSSSVVQSWLSRNGTTTVANADYLAPVPSGAIFSVRAAATVSLTAGDTIDLRGYSVSSNTSGVSLNSAGNNYISAALVSQ